MKNVNRKLSIAMFFNVRGLLGMVTATILVQSCCISGEGSTAACRLQKPPAYVFNESLLHPSVAVPAKSTSEETIPESLQPKVTETAIIVSSTTLLPVIQKTEKKLPLGLQSVGTNIIAGPNLSMKRSSEDYGNLNHKSIPGIGFQLGVGLSLGVSNKLAIEPSLLVKHNSAAEKLSYTNTGGEPGASTTDKYSYTYLSVPVHATVKASENLRFLLGPEVNYLMGAKVKYDGGDKESLTSNSIKLGLGLQAGIRYELPKNAGPSGMSLQLIYDHRLSRLNEKTYSYMGGGSSSEVPAWRMSSFNLSLIADLCEWL